MNDTGHNIVSGFRRLREFCREVSRLLGTTKGMMEKKRWEKVKRTAVFRIRSRDPYRWLSHEFCLFFNNTEHLQLLPFVAVIVDRPEEHSPDDYALLSAGCLVFADKKPTKVKHRWARWHVYMGDRRKDDGTVCIEEQQKARQWEEGHHKPTAGLVSVTTFAYPLVKIGNPEALQKHIVQPLLKLTEREAKKVKAKNAKAEADFAEAKKLSYKGKQV
jgi:hypothetical protein